MYFPNSFIQNWQPLPRVSTGGIEKYGLTLEDVTSTTFSLQIGTSYSNFEKAYVTIEYTKTTD